MALSAESCSLVADYIRTKVAAGLRLCWLALLLAAVALHAQDSPLVEAAKRAKLGDHLPVGPAAPEIVVKRWWNSPGVDLQSSRGSVVLLDFWATWCGPCVAGLPKVHALAREMHDQPFKVVLLHTPNAPYGLESATEETTISAFLVEKKVALPVALIAERCMSAYHLHGFPLYVLIDKKGRIRSASNSMPLKRAIRLLIDE